MFVNRKLVFTKTILLIFCLLQQVIEAFKETQALQLLPLMDSLASLAVMPRLSNSNITTNHITIKKLNGATENFNID